MLFDQETGSHPSKEVGMAHTNEGHDRDRSRDDPGREKLQNQGQKTVI